MAERDEQERELWTWLPVGIWMGTLLTAIRVWSFAALWGQRVRPGNSMERALGQWEVATRTPALLVHGLYPFPLHLRWRHECNGKRKLFRTMTAT
jgi:hypothetical protein